MSAANPERGEVALTVGDRSYKLVLDFDGICAVEELLSTAHDVVTIADVVLYSARGSHRHARALAWGMLRRFHPDVTLEQTGALLFECGGVEEFFKKVHQVRKSLEPDKEDRPTRPRRARVNGAGVPATSLAGASGSTGTRSGGSQSRSSSVK